MSGPSITSDRAMESRALVAHGDDEGTTWIGSFPPRVPHRPAEASHHGCTVVRRITDDLGREWRVRRLRSENCHGLLFQCAVRGVRSEVRMVPRHLESLTNEELVVALAATDD